MKKLWKSISYFKKMVFIYILAITFTALALTVFSYQRYSDILSKKLYDDYQNNLKKNAQIYSDLSSEIKQLSNAIIIDPRVENYFTLQQFDGQEHYLAYLKLKKYFLINPYLQSICVYNPVSDDAIFCGSDQFDVVTAWNLLKEQNRSLVFTSETGDEHGCKVLTFAFPFYLDSFDVPRGAFFINLDMEKTLDHILGKAEYNQIVLDADQSILLQRQSSQSLLSENGLKNLLQWSKYGIEKSGNDILTIEGEKYLCSYFKDEVSNAQYLSYVTYEDVLLLLKQQRNIFLFVCLLVMAISALFQYIITRKLYQPIRSITEEFGNSKFAKDSAMGEFELIRHVYENALAEIENLEEKNALYLPKLKADILRELILGNADIQTSLEKLADHGWKVPFEGMFLCSVKIEKYTDYNLMPAVVRAKIQQQLIDCFSDSYYIECITNGSDEVISLINTQNNPSATFDQLIEKLEWVKDKLVEGNNLKITLGLGGFILDVHNIGAVYKTVQELQNYRFVLGYNQVIYHKKVLELLPDALTNPDKIISEIVQHMILKEWGGFVEKVDDYLQALSQYTYQTASMLFFRLYLEAVYKGQQTGIAVKNQMTFFDSGTSPKTLAEAKELMHKVYDAYGNLQDEARQIKSNKHYKKIKDSQSFIMEHFKDCTLSVDMIAEKYGYSTNYFARIFKSITGFYINDYLRQVRIMKAQELLLHSEMTINDIAADCGFTTPNYFHSIFKKETGLTPAAYRNASE